MDSIDNSNKHSRLKHIAIIMDGNGRWANFKGQSRHIGHKKGAENLEHILEYIKDHNLCDHITLFAFSTENWARPKDEISFIFSLLESYLINKLDKLRGDSININFIGDISVLDTKLQRLIEKAQKDNSPTNTKSINIALNYGGQNEALFACRGLFKKFLNTVKKDDKEIYNKLKTYANNLKYNDLSNELFTATLSNPDLLIRTGGHSRLSNFLLLQLAYTELFFTDTLWPDFTTEELKEVLSKFEKIERKFGAIPGKQHSYLQNEKKHLLE